MTKVTSATEEEVEDGKKEIVMNKILVQELFQFTKNTILWECFYDHQFLGNWLCHCD